jgi:hypothetical protein
MLLYHAVWRIPNLGLDPYDPSQDISPYPLVDGCANLDASNAH